MSSQPGTRVIAISHEDEDGLHIFGYGIYEGKFLPPFVNIEEEVSSYRDEYEEARRADPNLPEQFDEVQFRATLEQILANPRIKLDSGKTVWGYECWWSPVDQKMEDELKGKKILEVDVDAERRRHVN
jgi:hypothetical protein